MFVTEHYISPALDEELPCHAQVLGLQAHCPCAHQVRSAPHHPQKANIAPLFLSLPRKAVRGQEA